MVPLIHVSSKSGSLLLETGPGPCLNLKLSRQAFSFAAQNPASYSALKSGAWRTLHTNVSSLVIDFVIDVVVNQFMRRYVEEFLNGANQLVKCSSTGLLGFCVGDGAVNIS